MDLMIDSFFWAVLLSPFWIVAIIYFTWRKFILHRVRFLLVASATLSIALVTAILMAYGVAAVGTHYVYFSSQTCKPILFCTTLVYVSANKGAVLLFIYILLLIGFIVVTKIRKPKWLGFYTHSSSET